MVKLVPKAYLWLQDIPGHMLNPFQHSAHIIHTIYTVSQAKGKSGLIYGSCGGLASPLTAALN